MIQIGLLGASGRMGQWVSRLVGTDYNSKVRIAASAGTSSPLEALLNTEVVIDFSSPEAVMKLAHLALDRQAKPPAFVVGSTGWKPEQRKALESLSSRTQVLVSANFSTGVLALLETLKLCAPTFLKLGYTPVIVESHHEHKKDAPSGTALALQRAISSEEVQTHSVRAGEVIGDHEVTFYGPADHITLGHFAQDRSVFARGALDVAIWLAEKRKKNSSDSGLLSMETFFKERFL